MDGFHKDKYPSCFASQWEKATPQSFPVGLGTVNAAADCDNGLFLGSCLPPMFPGITPQPQVNHRHLNLSQNLLQG